jgi:hypothetical protein
MMQSTPEIKVKMRLCLAKCPKRQQNSPTNRNSVAKMKNSADLVTASGTQTLREVVSKPHSLFNDPSKG